MKLTDWYPPSIRSVRKGHYQVEWDDGKWFNYFDGILWHWGDSTLAEASRRRICDDNAIHPKHESDILRWRGVREARG